MATIKPSDGFLKMILGDGISVALDVVAEADKAGTLRFINGTGLRVSLPVPTLPTGPFELQLINLGLEPGRRQLHESRRSRSPPRSAWRSDHLRRRSIAWASSRH